MEEIAVLGPVGKAAGIERGPAIALARRSVARLARPVVQLMPGGRGLGAPGQRVPCGVGLLRDQHARADPGSGDEAQRKCFHHLTGFVGFADVVAAVGHNKPAVGRGVHADPVALAFRGRLDVRDHLIARVVRRVVGQREVRLP